MMESEFGADTSHSEKIIPAIVAWLCINDRNALIAALDGIGVSLNDR